jgi:hypothetical protein
LARQEWFASTKPWADPAQLGQAALAGAYLDSTGVPEDAPFVVILGPKDWNDVGLMGHILRAGLPPARVPHLYVYVGTPESYRAGKPVDTLVSKSYFGNVRSMLAEHPPALILRSFNPVNFASWAGSHPRTVLSSALAVVEGPEPGGSVVAPDLGVGPLRWWKLALLGLACWMILTLVGLGWALAGLRRWLRPAELIGISPAVGIAALLILGIAADRLGIRLVGAGGALVVIAAAGMGAGLFALVRSRAGWSDRRSGEARDGDVRRGPSADDVAPRPSVKASPESDGSATDGADSEPAARG